MQRCNRAERVKRSKILLRDRWNAFRKAGEPHNPSREESKEALKPILFLTEMNIASSQTAD